MISAIFSCMNREENLEKSLPTWLDYEEIDDIVIVDWSSKNPIRENQVVRELVEKSPKIKIARVNNMPLFDLAKSYNLAVKLTDPKNKIFLKLDCDHQSLDRGWIDNLHISGDTDITAGGELRSFFVTGTQAAGKGFSFGLCGILLANKKDFLGYNENFSGWGHDDIDLYYRMSERIPMRTFAGTPPNVPTREGVQKFIHHIPHDNFMRTENYLIKDKNQSNELNARLAGSYWSPQIFQILKREKQYMELEFLPTPFPKEND